MHIQQQPRTSSGQRVAYEIKVSGAVNEHWPEWFSGLALTLESKSDGAFITTLTGTVADQAALRGILNKLWDLNLTLISVTPLTAVA